jgi:hypothetical protein
MRTCAKTLPALLLIASTLSGNVYANDRTFDTTQVVEDAMARADGDSLQALHLLARDVVDFTNDGLYQERDLAACRAYTTNLEERLKLSDPGFLEKAWDSDLVKVGLFVAGVWLGRDMVKVK